MRDRLGLNPHTVSADQCYPDDDFLQKLEMPNPFFDKAEAAPGMTPAAIGYRYRKFQLG